MRISDMWKANATTMFLMILLNLALFSLGTTPWLVLGLIWYQTRREAAAHEA